jgi:hypothetical protein
MTFTSVAAVSELYPPAWSVRVLWCCVVCRNVPSLTMLSASSGCSATFILC